MLYRSICEFGFVDPASTIHRLVCPASFQTPVHTWCVFRLREWIDSLVIVWVIFLLISCDMPNWFGPGVLGGGPSAICLNCDSIDSTADAEETIFTPVLTPRVPDKPVFLTTILIHAISDDRNLMDNVKVMYDVTEDSTGVVFEGLGNRYSTGNRASLINFLHHVLFTLD